MVDSAGKGGESVLDPSSGRRWRSSRKGSRRAVRPNSGTGASSGVRRRGWSELGLSDVLLDLGRRTWRKKRCWGER